MTKLGLGQVSIPAYSLSLSLCLFLVFRTKIARSCLARGGAWADGQIVGDAYYSHALRGVQAVARHPVLSAGWRGRLEVFD
jgi:hypothetical protein